ncbi:molybdate ABC transporter permease subunit [Alkalibacillus salilacus]|uniref:Molybdenum transport system permease n=1 Tax=Alkalibacillus salilacus TaxID=284582 RepID=A0ABT9VBD1_9BACI|nr:molybdate ABC transporter permease subunit [Alkalibacillus salilacus]MDQ0158262.1 molybdate transport system permease protein [Alkalibacillus salilacus]
MNSIDLSALWLSLQVALLATVFAFAMGTILAWWFATSNSRLARLLSILVTVPLILPPTVLGYYILVILSHQSWLTTLIGGQILFTWKAAVIVATIAALPLVIRPIQVAFESIDSELLRASELDGASKWQQLLWVIIPLSYRGIIAGVTLGFARAMGEFGATLMVAGNIPGETQTLSIAIYDAVQANRMTEANIMVVLLTVTTLLLLWFAQTKSRSKPY